MSFPISGFTAVPNPMMLSFLATQGFAIMYYGGAGWQFGKRKVSGMSNEEVNKMTPNDFLMKLHSETKTMVPTMAKGMEDMTPLITTTMEQFGSYIREAIKAIPSAVSNIFTESANAPLSSIGGGAHSQVLGYAPALLQRYSDEQQLEIAGSQQNIRTDIHLKRSASHPIKYKGRYWSKSGFHSSNLTRIPILICEILVLTSVSPHNCPNSPA